MNYYWRWSLPWDIEKKKGERHQESRGRRVRWVDGGFYWSGPSLMERQRLNIAYRCRINANFKNILLIKGKFKWFHNILPFIWYTLEIKRLGMISGDLRQYKEILICVIVHESNGVIRNKKNYQCLNIIVLHLWMYN